MAKVLIYDDTDFPSHYRWQVLDFMRMEWPSIFSGENRLQLGIYPQEAHPTHFLAAEGDVLISYATVIWVDLEQGGETYRVYGVGNVLTYPSFRGEGFGSRVVGAATRFIETSDADVGALFCDSERAGFYGRHGWEALQGAVTLTGPEERPQVYDALRMMLFLSEKGQRARESFRTEPWYVESLW